MTVPDQRITIHDLELCRITCSRNRFVPRTLNAAGRTKRRIILRAAAGKSSSWDLALKEWSVAIAALKRGDQTVTCSRYEGFVLHLICVLFLDRFGFAITCSTLHLVYIQTVAHHAST